MKLFFVLIILVLGINAHAQGGPLGAGIILGNPSAVTAKYFMDDQAAIDGGLSFDLDDYVLLYGDYLYHYPELFAKTEIVNILVPYFGVGGVFVITTDNRRDDKGYLGNDSGSFGLAVRIPIGVEWKPKKPTIGVFAELAPGLAIIPDMDGFVQGGVGIRYYF
jgi:hypothetical protein